MNPADFVLLLGIATWIAAAFLVAWSDWVEIE